MAHLVNQFYDALIHQSDEIATMCEGDIKWHVCAPIDDLQGMEQLQSCFWEPIADAFSKLEYRPFIQLSEDTDGKQWTASTGVFVGNFIAPFFGIPPTYRTASLRFTQLVEISEQKITRGYIILDLLDLMDQAGVNPLRPSAGRSGTILPPSTMDGLDPDPISQQYSLDSMKLVDDMLAELGRFDGKSLNSMNLHAYWHDDFMWYGPAGIGTTQGIDAFRQQHQGPFVFSFPDRGVDEGLMFIARGNYVATGGWPHMHGTHTSGGWLGFPATNKTITLRVMDIWRREDNKLKENWVAIDLIDIFRQLGLDVFAMMSTAYPKQVK